MTITITLTDGEARSVFPEVICEYGLLSTADQAVDFVKGACLHCIGDWRSVPDAIEFKVVDRRKL